MPDSQHLRATIPNEGVWLIVGTIVGALLPVRNWLNVDLRLWGFLVGLLGSLTLVAAAKMLKAAYGAPPQGGWSISKILASISTKSSSVQSRRLGVSAAWLFAVAMIMGGVLLGQVIAIFTGFGASR